MRAIFPLAVTALLTTGLTAGAQVRDPPLLDAYRNFCIMTGAQPDVVAAMVQSGGANVLPTNPPSWTVMQSGTALTVSATPGRGADKNEGQCTITDGGGDETDLNAVRTWIGVPMDEMRGKGSRILQFVYRESHGTRSLPAGRTGFDQAAAAGELWQGTLTHDANGTSITVRHRMAPRPVATRGAVE